MLVGYIRVSTQEQNTIRQEVLLEEGLHSVDAFVALTGSDEENILISIYAASQKVPSVNFIPSLILKVQVRRSLLTCQLSAMRGRISSGLPI